LIAHHEPDRQGGLEFLLGSDRSGLGSRPCLKGGRNLILSARFLTIENAKKRKKKGGR